MVRRIEQAVRDRYLELRETQLKVDRAQEELATRIPALETELEQQRTHARSTDEILATVRGELSAVKAELAVQSNERASAESRVATLAAELEAKHQELMEVVFRVRSSRERQLQAEQDLRYRSDQVVQLREQLAVAAPAPPPSGTPTLPPQ